ncbi:MAG: carboxymuconolactone decarboxylase family protein [Planctomycetota bacterium]|nr:MAG: carboxymuconolactone decarboxylase family protein [Planctomycetota bacterium]
MSRLQPVTRNAATPAAAELLDAVSKKLGSIPNLIATMAHSPAVARGYLDFSQALSTGTLPARLREQLALAVGEANTCQYCVAAHTFLGRRAGLSEHETRDARRGVVPDKKEHAALAFAKELVESRGHVGDEQVQQLRLAGYTDGEIAEIVAHVALNVFTNYFNLVADTELDFPAVPELAAA